MTILTGDLRLHRYKDRETGEPWAALRMTADNVALLPYRIERIALAPRRGLVKMVRLSVLHRRHKVLAEPVAEPPVAMRA